jgi:1-deoxy-D-xylulose-5-phosphate synthase
MIVLNDNEMSISKNVGALSEYFAKIRLSRGYFGFKRTVKQICTHIPLLGRPLIAAAIQIKEFIKRVLNQKNIFENFGLEYLGPLDGSDEASLEAVFREAMDCDEPCVVHVVTKKGQG